MAADPPPDLVLTPLGGEGRTVREWLTTFHLAFVAIDPFTHESAWILPTAARILTTFEQADVRVAFLCAGTPEECRMFLGPHAQDTLTFVDPDRVAIKGCGLERLPAFVHLAMDGTIANAAEGWDPAGWKTVADHLALVTSWTAPVIPLPRDPGPFEGSPAVALI
ncbi:MAG: hypothetical protein H0W70_14805 [Actinobacteria bacterium]|nr:hypothetical protein [Actinomycetota bacterium]